MENFELQSPDKNTIYCNIDLLKKACESLKEIILNDDNEALDYLKEYLKGNYLNPDKLEVIEPLISYFEQDKEIQNYILEHFEQVEFNLYELPEYIQEKLHRNFVEYWLDSEIDCLHDEFKENYLEYINPIDFDDTLLTILYKELKPYLVLESVDTESSIIEVKSKYKFPMTCLDKMLEHETFKKYLSNDLTDREIKHFKIAKKLDYFYIDSIDELDVVSDVHGRSELSSRKLHKYAYRINRLLDGIYTDLKTNIQDQLSYAFKERFEHLQTWEYFENHEIETKFSYNGTRLN